MVMDSFKDQNLIIMFGGNELEELNLVGEIVHESDLAS